MPSTVWVRYYIGSKYPVQSMTCMIVLLSKKPRDRWPISEDTPPFSVLGKYICLEYSLGVDRAALDFKSQSPDEQSSTPINPPRNINKNFTYLKRGS